MDRFTFLHLVTHPETLITADVDALEMVATSFPYCQTTYILLAKASHNAGSMLANKKLKTAAAFAANRSVLKKIINDEFPNKAMAKQTMLLENTSVLENNIAQEIFETINIPEAIEISEIIEMEQQETVVSQQESIRISEENNKEEPTSNAASFADEIANNLLFWHEMRQKATAFWKENSETAAVENEVKQHLDEIVVFNDVETVLDQELEVKDVLGDADSFVEEIIQDTFEVEATTFKPTLTEVPLAYDYIEISNLITEDPATPNDFLAFIEATAVDEKIEVTPAIENTPKFYFDQTDFRNITTEIELDNHNENELLLEYLLALKKDKKKKRVVDKNKKEIQDEIIDNFIKLRPGISRVSKQEINNLQGNNKDLSLKSIVPNQTIISETLAKIMVKQNKISSAIEMYHKLILKYPEKKTYFAGIIESLEEK